ncbi:MAG: hypothetical protein GXP35_14900 [Actinobacteria bacterium]|nr:hypothetical protein [Actinomycetota bacterium]
MAELFSSRGSQRLLFGGAVGAMVIVRFVVYSSGGAPPTVDAGNWLAFGDSLLGDGIRDSSISYPPTVPLLTKAAVAMFGLTVGVSLLAAIATAAPAVGLFHTLGAFGIGRLRLVPTLLLLCVGSVSEAAAWGGFPQLLAMGVLPVGVLLGHRLVVGPSRRTAVSFGLALMASFAISHFVSAILVLAVALLVIHHLIRAWSVGWVTAMAKHAIWVLLPLVWLIPIYWNLIDAILLNPNEFGDLDNVTFSNLFNRLEHIYSDAPILWRLMVPLTVVTPWLSWRNRASAQMYVFSSLYFATGLLLVVTRESRYLYLLPMLAMLASSVWLAETESRYEGATSKLSARQVRLVVAFVVIVLFGQAFGGIRQLDNQRDFYAVMRPPLIDAIEAADDLAGPDEVIAVPSVRGAPIGWWVEALSNNQVLYGSPLRWLNFADEVDRASRANAIFQADFPNSESLELLREADVSVVLVPRTWTWFDHDRVLTWAATNDIEVELINGDAVVLSVG